MSIKTKDVEWTIAFNFVPNTMFPNKINGYQSVLNENVLTWTDKALAEQFATEKCGKYGWDLVPTKSEYIHTDEIIQVDTAEYTHDCFWNR